MILSLGLDIGGTHIAGALVNEETRLIVEGSYQKYEVNAGAASEAILEDWTKAVKNILKRGKPDTVCRIGVAMPGPFDYEKGISWIRDLGKYDSLYGMNVKEMLKEKLGMEAEFPVYFENDAVCFGLGECRAGAVVSCHRVVALTLGTGLGSAFLVDGCPLEEGEGIPEGGSLYQLPYKDGTAEDYFSSRGLLKEYERQGGRQLAEVKTLAERASRSDAAAKRVFSDFGKQLAAFLAPWLCLFKADCVVLGGGISKASDFFINEIKEELNKNNLSTNVVLSSLGAKANVLGAAGLPKDECNGDPCGKRHFRQSGQPLLPLHAEPEAATGYDIYPAFHLPAKQIYAGTESLADYIISQKTVIIDGYAGVFWQDLKAKLAQSFADKNIKAHFCDTADWLLPPEEIETLVRPYLGEKDSVWGTKTDKSLSDFFDKEKMAECVPDPDADVNIVIGSGAALAHWEAPLIYFDLPKNELQYRARAGSVTNLGAREAEDATQMYKRFYFVDWTVLNKHKKDLLSRIIVFADDQRPDSLTWMYARDLREALCMMSEHVFRVRPWFEPGAWGGQWMKKNIKGVNPEEINYAWSFELITPENGLLLESDGLLLEASFDLLMFSHKSKILGEKHAVRFGDEFPIRFDFLDTVEGGNLSIQCHPSVAYIREHFGENITQDETYYILDAEKNAGVYLGFREDIDQLEFREALEKSNAENVPVEIIEYVQYHPAKKHDLFLIPNGTVHSAGAGNLVLEISATPYIFTFKMYDWLRLDLNGNPRPINIGHAFENLDFSRKGEKVKNELISKPYVLASGEDWKQVHLPTHPQHFYDVHRYEFTKEIQVFTEGSCHVLMLVEGSSVIVETKGGFRQRFHYAETFVIPAAAKTYRLINEGKEEAKVVKAFLKEGEPKNQYRSK